MMMGDGPTLSISVGEIPGATNFSTAAAYAHLGGFPMVILTGQKPIRHSKQGHFQIVDIVEHFKPITK